MLKRMFTALLFLPCIQIKWVDRVMNETLRMFPPVSLAESLTPQQVSDVFIHCSQALGIPKVSAEDTTLTTTNAAGEPVVVAIPKGTALSLYVIGMHYNRMS